MQQRTEKQSKQISGYEALAMAVVQQAVADSANGMKRLDKKPDDAKAQKLIGEATAFLLSEDLKIFTDLDGEWLLRETVKNYKSIRKKM